MIIIHPWLLIFGSAALLLVLGATSGLVNSKLWISEPLVCAMFGVAISPLGLGLLVLDPVHDPQAHAFLREAARVTLAIAVLAAAIRLPPGWLRAHWRGLGVALGPGMLLMWGAGAAVTAYSFNLPWLVCWLIGAIIAPTDPVLSAPVVGGELAHRAVPFDLRHAITAESGINDGLAGPIVMLPVIALGDTGLEDSWQDVGNWLLHTVLWETGSAIVLGAGAGAFASILIKWAAKQIGAERSSLLTIALALALATLTGLQAIGSNGVLGAFVAGAQLNNAYEADHQEHQEQFNEAITRFFDLPIMILLGVAAPWSAWIAMGWRAPAFVAGILFLRRIPAWLLLRRFMPWARRIPENPVRRLVRPGRRRRDVLRAGGAGHDRPEHAVAHRQPRRGRLGGGAWRNRHILHGAAWHPAEGKARNAVIRLALLVLVPVAPVMNYLLVLPPIWVFLAGILGVGILADWIRAATEQLAQHTGPAAGGLLTVSLGSLAELILALFVLAQGEPEVVHAQITGSIIGTSLLGLGLAIVVGGSTRERQTFRRERAGLLSSLLILVVIALLLPAVFDFTARSVTHTGDAAVSDEALSLIVSSVLLLLYLGNLAYTLVTHRDVFSSGEGARSREGLADVGNAWLSLPSRLWRRRLKAS